MERSNLAAVQEAHARTHPHDEALVDGALRLTHSQFAQRIAQTAKHLRTLGAGPGVLVGVALGDHATHVIIMLALARIGAVLLPLDHRWTPGERERVATHFGAALALVEPCQAISGTPCVEVSEKWPDTVSQCAADPVMAPGGDAPLLVSLSSGTTGRPKGPRITHAQFLARFRTHWIDLGFVAQDCFVCATPLYFGAGRTFVWSTLYAGGKVVLAPPPFDPPALLDTLAREHATTLFLVPTQLRRLLAEHAGAAPLKRLRLLFSSGAPLTREERRAIHAELNAYFCEYYASTEGGGVTLLKPADIDKHSDTVGRAIHAVDVEIVDAHHQPVSPGTVGLLRYRSPGCAIGFYRDDEASQEAFRDGWFYPGDLAQLDAAGYLTLAGRAKDMIIRGGINVYPEEVEAALQAHPAVREAAVVGMPSVDLGEEIAAFIVSDTPVGDTVLRDWCAARLAPYKVPRVFRTIADLPRNTSGKVQKAQLKTML